MKAVIPSPILRWALVVDAAASASIAALQLAAPDLLVRLLALPRPLLVETALFLVAYVTLLLVLAGSRRVWAALVAAVVAGNVAWAALSLLLPVAGFIAPNGWGLAYVVGQALAVLAFAAVQSVGLRRSLPTAPVTAATERHGLG